MAMKYVVVRSLSKQEQLFVFPYEFDHDDFFSMLQKTRPHIELVSAGLLSNYRDTFTLGGKEADHDRYTFDQIGLGGESITLGVHFRPEDVELFRRLANGY